MVCFCHEKSNTSDTSFTFKNNGSKQLLVWSGKSKQIVKSIWLGLLVVFTISKIAITSKCCNVLLLLLKDLGLCWNYLRACVQQSQQFLIGSILMP